MPLLGRLKVENALLGCMMDVVSIYVSHNERQIR